MESETLQFLNDLIIIVLGFEIIPQFQKKKEQEYGELIDKLASFEYNYSKIV